MAENTKEADVKLKSWMTVLLIVSLLVSASICGVLLLFAPNEHEDVRPAVLMAVLSALLGTGIGAACFELFKRIARRRYVPARLYAVGLAFFVSLLSSGGLLRAFVNPIWNHMRGPGDWLDVSGLDVYHEYSLDLLVPCSMFAILSAVVMAAGIGRSRRQTTEN